jgi:hypothetical protein
MSFHDNPVAEWHTSPPPPSLKMAMQIKLLSVTEDAMHRYLS